MVKEIKLSHFSWNISIILVCCFFGFYIPDNEDPNEHYIVIKTKNKEINVRFRMFLF